MHYIIRMLLHPSERTITYEVESFTDTDLDPDEIGTYPTIKAAQEACPGVHWISVEPEMRDDFELSDDVLYVAEERE